MQPVNVLRRRNRLLLIGTLALGTAFSGVVHWIKVREAQGIDDIGKRVNHLFTTASQRPQNRQPLRGTAAAGNAWESYNKAFDLVKSATPRATLLSQYHLMKDGVSAEMLSQVIRDLVSTSSSEQVIQLMRRGVQCSTVQSGSLATQARGIGRPDSTICEYIALVSLHRARMLAAQGLLLQSAQRSE